MPFFVRKGQRFAYISFYYKILYKDGSENSTKETCCLEWDMNVKVSACFLSLLKQNVRDIY